MTIKLLQQPSIDIKPIAKRNTLTLCLSGALLLTITLLLAQLYWLQFRFVILFIILISLVVILLGVVKLFEPKISLYLTPSEVTYNHRYGNWHLKWRDIKNINIVSEAIGLQREKLPYVGIRLVDIDIISTNISVRLANRLIHQQKGLIVYGVLHQLMTIEQSQLNFQPFILSNGEHIKGPIAAFLHQSEQLYQAFGYHLYLPADSFDRSIDEFTRLLKECKVASTTY